MANNYDDGDGVWRTIGGRRVFIRTGQSLSDAMIESGKFSRVARNKNLYKKIDEEKEIKPTEKQKEAGERLNKKAQEGVRNDIKDFLSGKEDYDGSREDFINDLSNEWGVDKEQVEEMLHEENAKHPRLFKTDRQTSETSREQEIKAKQEAVNKSFEENQKELQSKLTDEERAKVNEVMTNKDLQRQVAADVAKSFGAKEVKVNGETINLEEQERLDIAKDIAKEVYGLNENNASPERIEREAKRLLEYNDGETLEKGDEPYKNSKGELERSTKSLKEWRNSLKGSAEENKYAVAKHEGFGDYNKDYVPVYDNKIDYTGDFSRADLSTLSDEELKQATSKQSELYTKAANEKLGDQRTRNGKMDKIFNTARKQQYENGINVLNAEMQKRGLLDGEDELSKASGGVISTLKTSVSSSKQERLKPGTEIYYKGDMANTPGYFTIESFDPSKEQFMTSITLKEKGGEGRTKKIGAQQIEDKYTNNYASRFSFKEDYDNYRNSVYERYAEMNKSKSMNDKIRDEAYKKYKKEHPGSKMTLAQFLKKQ